MKIEKDKIMIQSICLLLALALWIFVMVEINPKIDKDFVSVPVSIRNEQVLADNGFAIVDPEKENYTIDIKVSGYRSDLIEISQEDIVAYIDVLGYVEGDRRIPIELKVPDGIEIKERSREHILTKVEQIITKPLDVVVKYEGVQESGYYASKANLNPASVIVKGPRNMVNSASTAVVNISLNDSNQSITRSVPVSIESDTGKELPLNINPGIIEVTVPVLPTKTVEVIPQVTGTPKMGYEVTNLEISPKYIVIAAEESILNNINSVNTETLDISDEFYSTAKFLNIVNDGSFIVVDEQASPHVKVTIEKVIQKSLVYSISDINFTNVPEGFDMKVNSEEEFVLVTIKGISSIINQFSEEDLSINCDLSESTVGINDLLLVVNTDTQLHSIEISPETIQVELIEITEETDVNVEETEDNEEELPL